MDNSISGQLILSFQTSDIRQVPESSIGPVLQKVPKTKRLSKMNLFLELSDDFTKTQWGRKKKGTRLLKIWRVWAGGMFLGRITKEKEVGSESKYTYSFVLGVLSYTEGQWTRVGDKMVCNRDIMPKTEYFESLKECQRGFKKELTKRIEYLCN